MASRTFTADFTWVTGVTANRQYNMLSYEGSLGGGTLQVFSDNDTGVYSPVADSKLNASKVDDNGDAIKQMTFWTVGAITVVLSGSTAPNVEVYLG